MSVKWLLSFNVDDGKCKVLHIGPKNPRHNYTMNGECLPHVESEKDLGLYTDEVLNWNVHIEKSVNKAKSVIGWVKRSLICRNKFVMLNVYKSLIRPHIEYAVQAWNPPAGYWKHILHTRLKKLQLTTLLERRMRGDLIETFKITAGKVDYGQGLFRLFRSGMNILKDSRGDGILSDRVANYWNKVPGWVKECVTVETFKARLERYKLDTIYSGVPSHGHFCDLSEIFQSKINNCNHDSYENFMSTNPKIAKYKGVNVA